MYNILLMICLKQLTFSRVHKQTKRIKAKRFRGQKSKEKFSSIISWWNRKGVEPFGLETLMILFQLLWPIMTKHFYACSMIIDFFSYVFLLIQKAGFEKKTDDFKLFCFLSSFIFDCQTIVIIRMNLLMI